MRLAAAPTDGPPRSVFRTDLLVAFRLPQTVEAAFDGLQHGNGGASRIEIAQDVLALQAVRRVGTSWRISIVNRVGSQTGR
jgi:hypothetical protein